MVAKGWTEQRKARILKTRKGRAGMKVELRLEPKEQEVTVVVRAPALTPEVETLLERLKGHQQLVGFAPDGTAVPLEIRDILRFYGEDKGVLAQTAEGVFTVRRRLYELSGELEQWRFARISHSEIVNLGQVKALDLTLTGTIRIHLTDGTVCYASRRYVKRIKEVLGI